MPLWGKEATYIWPFNWITSPISNKVIRPVPLHCNQLDHIGKTIFYSQLSLCFSNKLFKSIIFSCPSYPLRLYSQFRFLSICFYYVINSHLIYGMVMVIFLAHSVTRIYSELPLSLKLLVFSVMTLLLNWLPATDVAVINL